MYFGQVKVNECVNSILAHTVTIDGKKFLKGRIISKEDQEYFVKNNLEYLICAKLAKKDIHEDNAANILAKMFNNNTLALEKAFTGRANILANESGLLVINEEKIRKFNKISNSITIATLQNNCIVHKGEMIATIKIIPFSIMEKSIKTIEKINLKKSIQVQTYKAKKCALLLTHFNQENIKLNNISQKRIKERLDPLNCSINIIKTCEHNSNDITKNIKKFAEKDIDLILILGSSAIVDIRDKIPEAIVNSGGKIIRFGMPVDPGNLLLLGKIKNTPIIGLPGCARSPTLNGFDWVLERLLSGNAISNNDISDMGVGGLLKTINKRKTSLTKDIKYKITNIILAAGQSKRMLNDNKLLIKINKKTMLATMITKSLNSSADNTVLVLGYQSDVIQEIIQDKNITTIVNKDFTKGLSSSLQCGISALPDDCDAAVIILADMPGITSTIIDNMINSFNPKKNNSIIIPTFNKKRGNPILLDRKFFPDILRVTGDKGAKDIIKNNKNSILEVPQKNSSVLNDIDTKEDLSLYLKNNT